MGNMLVGTSHLVGSYYLLGNNKYITQEHRALKSIVHK